MNISMHHNLRNGCQLDISIHKRDGKEGHEIEIIGSKGDSLYKPILRRKYFPEFTNPYCLINNYIKNSIDEPTVFQIINDDKEHPYRICVTFYTLTGDIVLNVLEDSFEFNIAEDYYGSEDWWN